MSEGHHTHFCPECYEHVVCDDLRCSVDTDEDGDPAGAHTLCAPCEDDLAQKAMSGQTHVERAVVFAARCAFEAGQAFLATGGRNASQSWRELSATERLRWVRVVALFALVDDLTADGSGSVLRQIAGRHTADADRPFPLPLFTRQCLADRAHWRLLASTIILALATYNDAHGALFLP